MEANAEIIKEAPTKGKNDSVDKESEKTSRKRHSKPFVIDADYRVGKRIGRGNFGEVRLGKTGCAVLRLLP